MALVAKVSQHSREAAHNTPKTTLKKAGIAEEIEDQWAFVEPKNLEEAQERLEITKHGLGVLAQMLSEKKITQAQYCSMIDRDIREKRALNKWIQVEGVRLATVRKNERKPLADWDEKRERLIGLGLEPAMIGLQYLRDASKHFGLVMNDLYDRIEKLEAIRLASENLVDIYSEEAREKLSDALASYENRTRCEVG